ncbi:hypothetical protein ACFWNK_05465 [Streptomyces sp. NPDC058417]|uniref:hypothetical protein n=1 Tax=unclassified Streptomyces TaxID=2593676 RepID=UPI00364902DB
MQRTTTTATLLLTVTVSALAGCVTVQHPPAPGASGTPAQPSVPRPDGRAGTRVVQAPAQEALERVAPERRAATVVAPTRPAAPPSTAPPARSHRAAPAPAAPHRGRRTHQDVRVPDADGIREEVRRTTDVCALGEQYGGWRADSPEAVICGETYGR